MPANISAPHKFVNALTPDAKSVLFEGAVEGHVLVKNVNHTLPLKSPQLVSVFGYDAKAPDASMPSGKVYNENPWTSGLEPAVFQSSEVSVNASPNIPEYFQVAFNGTLSVGGGSGANNGPYLSAPLDALQQRAYEDNTVLFWDSTVSSRYRGLMEGSDACLVFINAFAIENMDRPGIREDYSDGLVEQVASTCANTIVIIHNAGTRLVDRFADHENVTAIVFAHLPGQESGRAIVSLLYGDENFSGKLPYTVAKNESDYTTLMPDGPAAPYELFPQSNFDEGILTDYRYFDKHNITPRLEFGFGLSYTTFSFKNIQASAPQAKLAAYATGKIEQGGAVDLWDNVVTVTVEVSNTGRRSGAEVAQLYVAIPGGPPKQQRGFEKVTIAPGQTVQVAFSLTRRDLSTWDVVAQKWKLQSGIYTIFAGSSSRDLPLSTNLKLNSA